MIKIRNFDKKDFPQILEIEKECFGKDAYTREHFNYLSNYGDFLVAEDEKILGYVLYSWEGQIFSIGVKPEFQGRGIGSLLLSKALENLRYKVKVAWLQTKESNLKAQNFFKKFGFRVVKKLKRYYINEDGLLMAKKF